MYYLLLVFLVVTINYSVDCFTEEQMAMKNALRNNCIGETGVDIAILQAIDGGGLLTPDPKLKCYLKCCLEAIGCFDEGTIDMGPFYEMMSAEERKLYGPVITKCGTIKGEDDCDTVYLTNVCYQDGLNKDYFVT